MTETVQHHVDTLLHDKDVKVGKAHIKKMAEELVRRGVEPAELGRLSRMKMYQVVTKDKEDQAHTHDLWGFHLDPSWKEGPDWPVVQPAAAVKVPPMRKVQKTSAIKRTALLPDPQIGFRRMIDGTLIPTHDPAAMDVSLQVAAAAGADRLVNMGDHIDIPEWSAKFLVLPEFVLTTQEALDEGHRFLARQKAIAEEVDLLEGNHDARLGMAVARNAAAALRLRPACTPPDTWPVLSLQALMRLDDIAINYVGGYPAGRIELAPGNDYYTPLHAIHGEKLDVVKVAKAERQSFTQGHIHRISMHTETYEVRGEPQLVQAFSAGCLCRVDGAVPSTRGGTDALGVPITRWENWQQGMGILTEYEDGGWSVEIVPIHKGRAQWGGKTYDAAE
jgi:hypothetical protein